MNPLTIYRLSNFLHKKNYKFLAILLRNLNFFIFSIYLPPSCRVGRGTLFGYKGMGTVIHSTSMIGADCLVGHGVTLGTSVPYSTNIQLQGPSVGDNTFIGAGAKILGDIHIGSNCTIGAGSIVLESMPDNVIVVGIPAKIVGLNDGNYRAIRLA